MDEFEVTAQAFAFARARASVAATLEAGLLHTAVYDAREAGMSVRQAAAALRVPKSSVARHWRPGHQCPSVVPVWGDQREYVQAAAAVWAHAPERLDPWVPYQWEYLADGGRKVTSLARGVVAQLPLPVARS